MGLSWISAALLSALSVQAFTWTATPFNPQSIPLAVRTPYLSAWLPQGAGAALNDVWPTFWAGQIVGWAGFVRVDGVAYSFLGAPAVTGATFQKATQKSFKFTSTQSIFVLTAGPVDLTVTFLSPVEDISAEWASGDRSLVVNWNTSINGGIMTHQVQLASQAVLSEVNDQTQYGSAYYSTLDTAGTTYQTGADVATRAQFINNGALTNAQDTNFRAISNNWPVFAYSRNLGTVTSATAPTIFSVGHVRDPLVSYIIANNGRQNRSAYFWSTYPTVSALISAFLNRYSTALAAANAFDAQVNADASKISADYASIVALSIRQSLSANEITISKTDCGWVDVIFPAWPIFLYTNPLLGKYLLEGLFRYQATGQYPNKNAFGHNDGADEAMPGNMLIMALSYAQKTGDNSQLQQYSTLLNQWTQFLIAEALIPANQISTDDFAGPLANQTNLAIKGIIGIKAMSQISTILGNTACKHQLQRAILQASYVTQFLSLAKSTTGPHLTLSYGNPATWGLTYNLYSLSLFPQSLYTQQTAWYKTVTQPFGVPLDTRHTYSKIYTAAIATDTAGRDIFISGVKKYAADGLGSSAFGDWYETTNGVPNGFRARPVVGGHLALLVL
ncbi:hypothetical protein C8J56DRAFT_933888 [Mycena floridula]|nr:hypothetical protein C8J56DRAFT_933888 [Mycena floridula]